MPSPKSCFSRLRKYKFLTFPPVLFFQTSANTSCCFPGSSLWVCPCLLFSCEVLLFYAEVASKNAPQTRHKQLVQHPVDTARSGIFLLWSNPSNSVGSYSFCGHLLSYIPTHRLLVTSLCLGIWFCCSKSCVFHFSILNFLVLISKYFSSLPKSFWILPLSFQVLTKSPSLMSFSHFVTVSITIHCSGHEAKSCRTTQCWLPV